MQFTKNLKVTALLEMVCTTYQYVVCHACHTCTNIMHASYYGACVNDYAILITLVHAIAIYSKNFRVTAVLEMKRFEVTVALDVYHKLTPVTGILSQWSCTSGDFDELLYSKVSQSKCQKQN